MAARLGGDPDDIITDINITPFVDIILVVLIIFMVSANYIARQSIKVNLPEAATGQTTDSTSLGIALDSARNLTLDGEPITQDGLRARIREEKARTPDIVCLIAADRSIDYGAVVELIDLVKQEGVAKFALNIEPVAAPAEATTPAPAGP